MMSVMINEGNATFKPPVDYFTGNYAQSAIATGDVNGDGRLDVAISTKDRFVSVMLQRDDGTFASKIDYPVADRATRMVMSDLTNDGKVDIATLSYSGALSVLVNRGDGTFAPKVDYVSGEVGASLVAADLSGDGQLDLVATGHAVTGGNAHSRVSVMLNQGNGAFAAPLDYIAGYDTESLVAADFTGDGHVDLAVGGASRITVLPFTGCLP